AHHRAGRPAAHHHRAAGRGSAAGRRLTGWHESIRATPPDGWRTPRRWCLRGATRSHCAGSTTSIGGWWSAPLADAVVVTDHDCFDCDLVARHARYVFDSRDRCRGAVVERL
ncbi:hypothetical protein E1166_28435, partial [Micromonospora sp. KC213]